MTTNTHIAAQRAAFERAYEAYCQPAEADWFRREDDDPDEYYHVTTKEAWWGWCAALEAAPALDAQGERSGFPPRIMKLLLEVAEREGKGSRGPWEDGDGEPLQEDADAAISWIDHMASAPLPHAVGKPLSDYEIDALLTEEHAGDSEMHEFARQVLALFCKINGITLEEHS